MVRVGNKTSTNPKQCEGLNLQMCCISTKMNILNKSELEYRHFYVGIAKDCDTHLFIMRSYTAI